MKLLTRVQFFTAVIQSVLMTLIPVLWVHADTGNISLLYGQYRPQQLMLISTPEVKVEGAVWRGMVNTHMRNEIASPTPVVALTEMGSYIEARCTTAVDAVGVQFLGDYNDGWARIIVDGQEKRRLDTWGGSINFTEYIEVSNLPMAPHSIRVEATGQTGSNGGSHVTVVAFGCGSVSVVNDPLYSSNGHEQRNYAIYLPLVMS